MNSPSETSVVAQLRSLGFRVRLKNNGRDVGVGPQKEMTPALLAKIRSNKQQLIDELKAEEKVFPRPRKRPAELVGDRLTEIIKSYNYAGLLRKTKGCNCGSFAKKMNRWGIAGCEAREKEIVEHLVDQARKRFGIAPFARPIASRWLRQAIEQTKQDRRQAGGDH